eukprot:CAMPEP_0201939148 /NCGR_PEP_ID=MMETSP0903-20130614/42645_1 /ASSEMBLY_ACC=CAM_ASM_000552 /TAXON_ID=420261 /ORGANISM="Thalassiosira antarctica, Strain CCMP982" /LENGTH=50 /DNA_ID=CAMNT_0048480601 /DNA_START=105 /DNA_END=257 /DNA_ORIENTATION=+
MRPITPATRTTTRVGNVGRTARGFLAPGRVAPAATHALVEVKVKVSIRFL